MSSCESTATWWLRPVAATERRPAALLRPYSSAQAPSRGRKTSYVIRAQTGPMGGPHFPWLLPAEILVLSQLFFFPPSWGLGPIALPSQSPYPKHRLNAHGHPRAVLTEGSGVSTEESHEEDWPLAIPSPDGRALNGLRRPWRLELADLGSVPFTVGSVHLQHRHIHTHTEREISTLLYSTIRVSLLEKNQPAVVLHAINPSTREAETGGSLQVQDPISKQENKKNHPVGLHGLQ